MSDIGSGILCITGKNRNYAIEFDYVEELCQALQITPIPTLPDYFCGMGNYKGKIIPILRLEEGQEKEITVIIKWDRFILGAVASSDAFIAMEAQVKRMEPLQEEDGEYLWREKALCQVDGGLYSLIDVEETCEHLVLYP